MVTQTPGSHHAVAVQSLCSRCAVTAVPVQLPGSFQTMAVPSSGSHHAVTGSHCAVGGQTTWGRVTATGGAIN